MRGYSLSSFLLVLFVFAVMSPVFSQHPAEIHLQELFEYQGDRFTQDSNGVVTDHKSRLQWYITTEKSANREDWFSFEKTSQWAKDLEVAGGGWHMPDLRDIRRLLPEAFFSKYSKMFIRGHVWAVNHRRPATGGQHWSFSFSPDEDRMYERLTNPVNFRHAMAVRRMPSSR